MFSYVLRLSLVQEQEVTNLFLSIVIKHTLVKNSHVIPILDVGNQLF